MSEYTYRGNPVSSSIYEPTDNEGWRYPVESEDRPRYKREDKFGWIDILSEPGDATRYHIRTHLVGTNDNRIIVAVVTNPSSNVCAMAFNEFEMLRWRMVREQTTIRAPGSCYYIATLLAEIYGLRCQSEEDFLREINDDV